MSTGGSRHASQRHRISLFFCFVLLTSLASGAGQILKFEEPTQFFTNVAARLLRSELNLDFDRILIYPTNQYTPSAHRLLQVAANICDAATNRTITPDPQLPSVFRPLFRRGLSGEIFIAGYREVTDDRMTQAGTVMIDVQDATGRAAIPLEGTAFDPDNQIEPIIFGMPLIIGARKGFPAFNEFAMQTAVSVMRRLEFRRSSSGSDTTGNIVETNQMYIVAISNLFGVEAWNSYFNAFPRALRIGGAGEITMLFTNELGMILRSNLIQFAIPPAQIGSWPGFTNFYYATQPSFIVPVSNNIVAMTSSVWRPGNSGMNQFVGLSGNFDRNQLFPVPRWWITLRAQLRFYIVDTTVNRIVDYVNLTRDENALDITGKLIDQLGANNCVSIDPFGAGNMWCTNRLNGSIDEHTATFGIVNQIWAGRTANAVGTYVLDTSAGPNLHYAIDSFRYQFLPLINGQPPQPNPIFPEDQGKTFYRSNIFYAPIDPSTMIAIQTRLQANDPFVRFTADDLVDPAPQFPNVTFQSENPPLANLGRLNPRYTPWGGNPQGGYWNATTFDPALKDAHVLRSDDWNFPAGEPLTPSILGRVHRGTPWQTLYLKSPAVDLATWSNWTGFVSSDNASRTLPTNDWRIVSLLAHLLGTNDERRLFSVNDADPNHWRATLDGLSVLTNTIPDSQIYYSLVPLFDTLTMTSNSPQAGVIATAIQLARPAGNFRSVGDVFAVPELSVASPWLDTSTDGLKQRGITDEAYEIIPAQLLSSLRPDSVGTVAHNGNQLLIEFTGWDDYSYAIETSSNLRDWSRLSSNHPINGVFTVTNAAPIAGQTRFYRSVLLP